MSLEKQDTSTSLKSVNDLLDGNRDYSKQIVNIDENWSNTGIDLVTLESGEVFAGIGNYRLCKPTTRQEVEQMVKRKDWDIIHGLLGTLGLQLLQLGKAIEQLNEKINGQDKPEIKQSL